MTVVYPAIWSGLKWPWKRLELQLYLEELVDPAANAKWLNPDPEGPIIGIDQVFHFFFDDNDFDDGAIGFSLLAEDEVEAIAALKADLNAIWEQTDESSSDAFYLGHSRWPRVVESAEAALSVLACRGVATTS